MAEMTIEQLQGAVMALEAMNNECRIVFAGDLPHVTSAVIKDAMHAYRAQLAAMPPDPWTERERKLRAAVPAAYSARTLTAVDAALRPVIVDESLDRPTEEPDLRAALVEARRSLETARVELEWIQYNSAPLGKDSGVESTCRAACVASVSAAAAIARIDKVLEVKP